MSNSQGRRLSVNNGRRPSQQAPFLPPIPGADGAASSAITAAQGHNVPASVLGLSEMSAVKSMPHGLRRRASELLHRPVPMGAGTIPNDSDVTNVSIKEQPEPPEHNTPNLSSRRRSSLYKMVPLPVLTADISKSLTTGGAQGEFGVIIEENDEGARRPATQEPDFGASDFNLTRLGEQIHYPSMMSVEFTHRPLVIAATTTARNSTTAGGSGQSLLDTLITLFHFHFAKGAKHTLVRRPVLDDARLDEREEEDEEDPAMFPMMSMDTTDPSSGTNEASPYEREKKMLLEKWGKAKQEVRKAIRARQRQVLSVLNENYERDVLRQNNDREYCEEMRRYLEAMTLLDLAAMTFFNPLERSPKDPDPIPIEGGRVNELHHSFLEYRQAHWAEWANIRSIIFALECICRKYFIQYATIDTPILTLLAQHPHISRQLTRPEHLTPCFANKNHVETLFKFPGQRFLNRKPYSSDKKAPMADTPTHAAATTIQSKWRAYCARRIYVRIVPFIKAQKFIMKSWRRKKGREAMRAGMRDIWRMHESRSAIHRDAWKLQWDILQTRPNVCVWIPSFGTNGEFRLVSGSPLDYSLTELLPKFLALRDPTFSFMLILPRLPGDDCWEFVSKHLGISKDVFEQRVKILVPENGRFFKLHASTMSMVQASPTLMKRLKLLLKDKNAYLLSEQLNSADYVVSSQLQRPLLGPTGDQMRRLRNPEGWRELATQTGFSLLPGYQLKNRETFFRDFAQIVYKHYTSYSRWVGYYQTPTWHYTMVLDLQDLKWDALEDIDEANINDVVKLTDEQVTQFQKLVEKHAHILASTPYDTWESYYALGRRYPMWIQALPSIDVDTKGMNLSPEYHAAVKFIGFHFYCDMPGRKCSFLGSSETLGSRYMEPLYTIAPQQSLNHVEVFPKFKAMAEKWMADGYSGHLSFTATLDGASDKNGQAGGGSEVKLMFVQMYYTKESGIAQWLPLISRSEWNEVTGHSIMDVAKATEPDVRYMNLIRFMNMDLVKREEHKEERVILWSDSLYHSHASLHTSYTFETLAHSTGIWLDPRLHTGSCLLPRLSGSTRTPLVCVSSSYRGVLEEWVSCIPRLSSFLTNTSAANSNFNSICKWALLTQTMRPLSRRNIQECKTLIDLCLLFIQNPALRKRLETLDVAPVMLEESSNMAHASSDHLWRNPHDEIADPVRRKLYFVAEFICGEIVRDCVERALNQVYVPPDANELQQQEAALNKQNNNEVGTRTGPDGITIIEHDEDSEDDEIDAEIHAIIEARANDKLENKMKKTANRFLHANSAVKTLRKLFQTTHDYIVSSQTQLAGESNANLNNGNPNSSNSNINGGGKPPSQPKKQSRDSQRRPSDIQQSAQRLSTGSSTSQNAGASSSTLNVSGGDLDGRLSSREHRSQSRVGSGKQNQRRFTIVHSTDEDEDDDSDNEKNGPSDAE